MGDWYVYMVRCADDSLYTGITRDPIRRVDEHNTSNLSGAVYTRTRRPVQLVYRKICKTRTEAARREYEIKQMSRQEKEDLLVSTTDK